MPNDNPTDMNQLRDMLIDTNNRLDNQEITPESAKATANLIGKVIGTCKVQMEYARLTGVSQQIDILDRTQKKDGS